MPRNDSGLLIIDTHVWYWLGKGDPAIANTDGLRAIEQAAKSNTLGLPAICVWEIAMLVDKRRIAFKIDLMDWVNTATQLPGLAVLPLTPQIAVESTRLPGKFHADPADQMIVATARCLDGTLVTRDAQILAYAKQGLVKTMAI